ncbi:MAG: hypothetical protein MUF34_02420 [Polyangiaceae bacterium]|nr:hypothetical protein [Polyangiaceae bacterium]
MKRPGTLGSKLHQDYPSGESLGSAADDMLTAAMPSDGAAAGLPPPEPVDRRRPIARGRPR